MTDISLGRAVLTLATEHGSFFKDLDKAESRGGTLEKSFKKFGSGIRASGADVDKFGNALSRTSGQFGSFEGGLTRGVGLLSRFAGAAGIGLGVAGLVKFGKEAIDTSGKLVDLSAKTKLSTDFLQLAGYIARQTGSSMEEFADVAFKGGVRIADGTADVKDGLSALGLEWEKIRRLKPEQQFDAIIPRLQALTDGQQQNLVATQIWGRGAEKTIGAFLENWDKAKQQAPIVAESFIRANDAMGDRLQRFTDQTQANVTTMIGSWLVLADKIGERGITGTFSQLLSIASDNRWETLKQGPTALVASFLAQEIAEDQLTEAMKNRAATETGTVIPADKSYADQLRAVQAELKALTPNTRAQLSAGLDLGVSSKDLATKFGISERAVGEFKRELSASTTVTKRSTDAIKALNAEIQRGADKLTGKATRDEIARTAREVERALSQGGIRDHAAFDALIRKVDEWRRAGLELPPVLDAIGRSQVALNVAATSSVSILRAHIATLPAATNTWKSYAEAVGLAAVNFSKIPVTRDANVIPPGATALPNLTLPDSVDAEIVAGRWVTAIDAIGTAASHLNQQLGTTIQSFGRVIEMMRRGDTVGLALTAAQGIADWRAALESGSRGQGALSGASTGAAIGGMFGPIGMGAGAAAGAVAGAITAGKSLNEIRDLWMALQGGLQNIQEMIAQFNNDPALVAAFNRLYFAGDEGNFQRGMDAYMRRLQELMGIAAEAQALGLDWTDKFDKSAGFADQFESLMAQRDRLAGQGFEGSAIVKAQADSWNELYQAAIRFGLDIPPQMQGVLRELVSMGLLVDENGNKILDLSGKNQKALTEMAAAIKKFDDEIAGLEQSIAGEAPEEHMGVVERQARDRIAALTEEREKAKAEMDRLLEESKDATEEWGRTHEEVADRVSRHFDDVFGDLEYEIPISFNVQRPSFLNPGEWPDLPSAEARALDFARPISAITKSGLGWLEPGDIAGMPSKTSGLHDSAMVEAHIYMNDEEIMRALVEGVRRHQLTR